MSTPTTSSLTCPKCGTQINPPPTLTKVVCPRCGAHIPTGSRPARLVVQRVAPAAEPHLPAQYAQPTAPASDPVGVRVEGQTWVAGREQHYITPEDWKNWELRVSPFTGPVLFALGAVAVLIVLSVSVAVTVAYGSMFSGILFPLVGLFAVLMFWTVVRANNRRKQYEAAFRAYRANHDALLGRDQAQERP